MLAHKLLRRRNKDVGGGVDAPVDKRFSYGPLV